MSESMTQSPTHLPEFSSSPLIEVAISLQFATLSRVRTVHLGFLWDVFRANFPKFAEHPPLNPAFETFGPAANPSEQVRFELVTQPPLPRVWFLDQKGVELIQFQADRFIHNWRKVGDETTYPRYERIRERFLEEVALLAEFLNRESLGAIEPNQCELTYINHIISLPGEDLAAEPGKVLRTWDTQALRLLPLPREDARMMMRFILRKGDDEPLGRILVSVDPGRQPDGTSVVQLTLVGRGRPAGSSASDIQQFLDLARENIGQVFLAITTDEMQQRWGRQQ
jgi:uncharacterized protein (TIGR04255 family)